MSTSVVQQSLLLSNLWQDDILVAGTNFMHSQCLAVTQISGCCHLLTPLQITLHREIWALRVWQHQQQCVLVGRLLSLPQTWKCPMVTLKISTRLDSSGCGQPPDQLHQPSSGIGTGMGRVCLSRTLAKPTMSAAQTGPELAIVLFGHLCPL